MFRSRQLRVAATALIAAGLWTGTAMANESIPIDDGGMAERVLAAERLAGFTFEGRDRSGRQRSPAGTETAPGEARSEVDGRSGRILEVGPGKRLAVPSEAVREARDGDVIEIAAGTYRGDVASWRRHNLTLRGVGGMVHLIAEGQSAERKAIWVIKGNNTRVENIIFSGARVGGRNGAGIRLEGAGLTVEHSEFRDNEMGILGGDNRDSDVVIRKSRFVSNRVDAERPLGHNIYFGNIRSLALVDSVIEGAVRGHNVKSRAAQTTLTGNRIRDGEEGASSYLVDLPAGGIGIVRDNILEQGPHAENLTLISYGAERLLHDDNRLIVEDNRFINRSPNGTFINNHTDFPVETAGNSFEGPGTILRGAGQSPPPARSNRIGSLGAFESGDGPP